MIKLAMYKRLAIPSGLKDEFVEEVKKRKGVRGGVILEATVEAIELWLDHPGMVRKNE